MDGEKAKTRRRLMQNFLPIRSDSNIDENTDAFKNVMTQLRNFVNDINKMGHFDQAEKLHQMLLDDSDIDSVYLLKNSKRVYLWFDRSFDRTTYFLMKRKISFAD
jgi:hypothetical protein